MDKIKDIFFLIIFGTVATFGIMSFISYVKDISHEEAVENEKDMSDRMAKMPPLFIKDIEIAAEVADTSMARRQGLSGRMFLPEGAGMFFVFDKSTEAGIWMKDMLFPIDILWIDADFRIIHIVENASPDSFPRIFRPDTPAKYVLEVNTGFIAEHGIVLGDRIAF